MSDFWARKLGAKPQQQRTPVQNPVPGSSAPWWSSPTVPAQPSQTQPEPYQDNTPAPQEMQKTQRALERQTNSERCPECFSGDYFAPKGHQLKRCFDCGYPIIQSGSGLTNTQGDGQPSTPARQVTTANNYNPQDTSAGHIG